MSIEIKPEDFGEWDCFEVIGAGSLLFSEIHDLLFHTYNAGEGWTPWADSGDTPKVISELRGHIARIEEAIKEAKQQIAVAERPARLAAYRRAKREGDR